MLTEDFEQAQGLSAQVEQARQRAVLAASDAGSARDDAWNALQAVREHANATSQVVDGAERARDEAQAAADRAEAPTDSMVAELAGNPLSLTRAAVDDATGAMIGTEGSTTQAAGDARWVTQTGADILVASEIERTGSETQVSGDIRWVTNSGADAKVGEFLGDVTTAAGASMLQAITVRSGVRPEDHGAIGDGIANDGPALTAAMVQASELNVPLWLSKSVYGISAMLTFPEGLVVDSNHATIKQLTSFGNYGIKALSNTTIRGSLTLLSGATSTNTRGIYVEGDNFKADEITVKSPIATAGAGDSYDRAFFLIGKNAHIRSLTVLDFDYPVVIEGSDNVVIDNVYIKNYVRGIYVSEATNVWVNGGEITGTSPNAASQPGHNGVLIGANTNWGTGDLHFTNVKVEGAGEHGWRIGGNFEVKRVWFTDCSAVNTGGCGFKVLGGTLESQNTHDDIFFSGCITEDCGQLNAAHAGFMLELVTNVVLVNPIVRRKNKTYSAGAGIEIQAATNVIVTNPNIQDTLVYGFRVGFVLGNCEQVKLVGGIITTGSGHCISLEYTNRTFRRVAVEGHPQLTANGTAKALQIINNGTTSSVVGGSWITFQSVSASANLIDTASPGVVYGAYFCDVRGPFVDTSFKNGSVWVDNVTGIYRIRNTTWKTPTLS